MRDNLLKKIIRSGASVNVVKQFETYYDQFVLGETGMLDWHDVSPLSKANLKDSAHWVDEDPSLINRVAILKLNGGLGTSMGCVGPKCLISVSEKMTFLDISLTQMLNQRRQYDADIPFVLMNSFRTSEETLTVLPDIPFVYCFKQNKFPRLFEDSRGDFYCLEDTDQGWAPSGHGDLYLSLFESGLLNQLLDQGIEYLFVSNIDNLGPQLDLRLLTYMDQQKLSFLMEVIPKTLSDVKGGTPVMYRERLTLLERAQVPPEYLSAFEDLSTFPVFNTNNLWLHLPSVLTALNQGSLALPLIVNRKKLDGTSFVQFEMAMGAALGCFDRSEVVVVSRDRFLPVKTTGDLLVLLSDVIEKDWTTGQFRFSEGCQSYPKVSLHPSFSTMSGFTQNVVSVPSLKSVSSFEHLSDQPIG